MDGKIRNFAGWFLILGVVLAASVLSSAQVDPNAPSDTDTTDNNSGVYVRDSSVAMDRLTLAHHMESLKEWAKAADIYQEILEKYSDRVIPAASDRQYTSVTETVRNALCKWPAEGLDIYRGLYENTAANLLTAKPNDPATLHQVMLLYFPTDSAKTAAIRLMDIDFESGDFTSVMQIGRRLLDWHPNLGNDRPMVLYRTALADKLSGQTDDAASRLGELQRDFAQVHGTIGGKDVVLADALKTELATPTHIVQAVDDNSWTTVGGDGSRGKISGSTVRPSARLYSIPLTPVSWKWVADETQRNQLENQDRQQRKAGADLGVMPAVDHGQLFFQDNVRIYGIDLQTGAPLPGWAQQYPSQQGAYQLSGASMSMPVGRQLAVSIDDKHVAAVMYQPSNAFNPNINGAFPMQIIGGSGYTMDGILVCLDRDTGKELWHVSPHDLPDSVKVPPGLCFGGPPLIVGNSVLIGANSMGTQLGDAYVFCFDLTTGKYNWNQYIASAATTDVSFDADGNPIVMYAFPRLSFAGGRIFVGSNLGAIAALDAYTGGIIWLNIYRDQTLDDTATAMQPFFRGRRGVFFRGGPIQLLGAPTVVNAPEPWSLNPLVIQDGKVFLMPPPHDGSNVYIYDADSGEELKRVPVNTHLLADANDRPNDSAPDTLLGVLHDKLILGSDQHVWCIPWQKYDPDQDQPDDHPAGAWKSAGDKSTRGHGFVTADAVYLPTESSLERIDIASGKMSGDFPVNDWDTSVEGPGNVIATGNLMIIAGAQQVAVYTDLETARHKLDEEVSAAPADPLPQLHYAEVMLAAWQLDEAKSHLGKAFDLLGGKDHLQVGPMRQRCFADALNFADRLVAPGGQPIETIQWFYDIASQAAQTPAEQVQVRMDHATFDQAMANGVYIDIGAALDFYQQILSDNAMRLVSVKDQNDTISQAGVVATQLIDTLIAESPQAKKRYMEKYESAALSARGQALMDGDPQALLKVAEVYPNSTVVDSASAAAANIFEARGEWRQATIVWRQILDRGGKDREKILESLARDYLKIPGRTDVAIARLNMAKTINPSAMLTKPLELPDGSKLDKMTLAEAYDQLRQYTANAPPENIPDLHLATVAQMRKAKIFRPFQSPTPADVIDGVQSLIVPADSFARNDRLIGWTADGSLAVYSADKTEPIFKNKGLADAPLGADWTQDGLIVWSTNSVVLLDSESGQLKWQMNLSSLPPADATGPTAAASFALIAQGNGSDETASATGEHFTQVAPVSDRIILATSSGRVLGLDAVDGQVAWQTGVGGATIDRLAATDDFTVLRVTTGPMVDLVVINSYNGKQILRKSFDSSTGVYPLNFALGEDGKLVYSLHDGLHMLDLYDITLSDQDNQAADNSSPDNSPPNFDGMTYPGQLLIHDGRVLALTNDGKELRFYTPDPNHPDTLLPWNSDDFSSGFQPINSANSDDSISISGRYSFVETRRLVYASNLLHPNEYWNTADDPIAPVNVEHVLFGRDFLIVVDRPHTGSGQLGGLVKLVPYSRALVSKKDPDTGKLIPTDSESGSTSYQLELPNIPTETTWQAFEGGVAYCCDGQLHLLRGAREQIGN